MACIDRGAIDKARRYIGFISWKASTAEEARNLPIEVNDQVYVDGDRYLCCEILTTTCEGLRLVHWGQAGYAPEHATDYIDLWHITRDWSKRDTEHFAP